MQIVKVSHVKSLLVSNEFDKGTEILNIQYTNIYVVPAFSSQPIYYNKEPTILNPS